MAARDIMYDTCVKPLGQLLHAHAQMVLSQQLNFEIYFNWERKLWKKKISCSGVGSNLGLMHCRPLLFDTEPMGLWQLWTANLALILLTAAVSVDYSERPWPSGIYLEKAN